MGRRTGRAELDEHAEGRSFLRNRSRSQAVSPRRRPRSSPTSARGCRCCRSRSMSASRSRTGSTTCCRACAPRSRSRSSATTSTRCAPPPSDCASASPKFPASSTCRSKSRCAFPQLEIRVDYGRAALYGVQPAAVIDQLSRLSNGRVVSRVVDGYRRFDVIMRLPDRLRTTQRLGDLLIETPVGWIPARQIADIRETDGPNQILRENGRRRVVVLANTDGTRRHGADRRGDPRRSCARSSCPRASSPAWKAPSRRRKRRAARSACCRCSRSR